MIPAPPMPPSLPFPPAGNRPRVSIKIDDAEVLDSGVLIVRAFHKIALTIAMLPYEITFTTVPGAPQSVLTGNDGVRSTINIQNFDNALGTSMNATRIATVEGKPVWLSLFVEAIGADVKILSYTLAWEGSF